MAKEGISHPGDLERRKRRLLKGLGLTTAVRDTTSKERVIAAIKRLPAGTTLSEAPDLSYFLLRIEEDLAEFEAGRLVPKDELKKRFELR